MASMMEGEQGGMASMSLHKGDGWHEENEGQSLASWEVDKGRWLA